MKKISVFKIYFTSVRVNEDYPFSYALTKKCKVLVKLQAYGVQVYWKHFIH